MKLLLPHILTRRFLAVRVVFLDFNLVVVFVVTSYELALLVSMVLLVEIETIVTRYFIGTFFMCYIPFWSISNVD